jgi:DNA-binding transcriptional LysR family regulator
MDMRPIEGLWAHVHWLGQLAEQGSFTAAAQRLRVSKAAMSQRVAELEKAAGVALVARTTRSVRLTEAGLQLVEATRGAYAQIDAAFAGVRERASVPAGAVRLTAPVALGRQQLMPLLPAFLRAHPQVRIELDLSDRLSTLAQEGFDLAVRHTSRPPETHVAWELCETRTLLVAVPAYLRRRGTPQHPTDLAGHDCLYYPRGSSTPTWTFEHRQAPGSPESVAVRGPFAANNSEALREAALAGLGIALLPDFSAQAALRSRKLVAVLPHWQAAHAFGHRIYAIRPPGAHVPRAVRLLVEHLREGLRAGFAPGHAGRGPRKEASARIATGQKNGPPE